MFYFLIILGAILAIAAFVAVASVVGSKSNGFFGAIVGLVAFVIVFYIFGSLAEPFKSPPTPAEAKEQKRRAWSDAFERRNRAMEKVNSAAAANRADEGLYWAGEAEKAQQVMNENQDWDDSAAVPSMTATPATPAVVAPKIKAQLEISNMGIDSSGHFQVQVRNHTPVPLDLVNVSWFFYDRAGNPVMVGDYPQTVITSGVKDDSDSTVIAPEESKTYYNPLVPAQRIFSDNLGNVSEAEIKIYILRTEFEALNLDSDIECHETTIRQIFQSQRFPLR